MEISRNERSKKARIFKLPKRLFRIGPMQFWEELAYQQVVFKTRLRHFLCVSDFQQHLPENFSNLLFSKLVLWEYHLISTSYEIAKDNFGTIYEIPFIAFHRSELRMSQGSKNT